MVGSAMRVSVVTEAPTMPAAGARTTPISVTAMGRPPGTRRRSRRSDWSSSVGESERGHGQAEEEITGQFRERLRPHIQELPADHMHARDGEQQEEAGPGHGEGEEIG